MLAVLEGQEGPGLHPSELQAVAAGVLPQITRRALQSRAGQVVVLPSVVAEQVEDISTLGLQEPPILVGADLERLPLLPVLVAELENTLKL